MQDEGRKLQDRRGLYPASCDHFSLVVNKAACSTHFFPKSRIFSSLIRNAGPTKESVAITWPLGLNTGAETPLTPSWNSS